MGLSLTRLSDGKKAGGLGRANTLVTISIVIILIIINSPIWDSALWILS